MQYDEIFAAYYNLYRAEATTPASTDDEYTIGMRLANEAIARWENYDGTYWKELFQTNQNAGTGGLTLITGQQTYAGPTDMQEGGGYVRLSDANGTVRRLRLIDPQEGQFLNDNSNYAYFTGNPSTGFTLNINPDVSASDNGLSIDYDYYKKATKFTTGTDTTEMSNPYFIVHRMLANRFRASRNPYYSSALRDAEDALKIMKMDNDSGTWANPWSLPDRSGTRWGV